MKQKSKSSLKYWKYLLFSRNCHLKWGRAVGPLRALQIGRHPLAQMFVEKVLHAQGIKGLYVIFLMTTGLANMFLSLLSPLSFLISIFLKSSLTAPNCQPVRLQSCRCSRVLRSRDIFTAALTCFMQKCFLFGGSYRQVPQRVPSYGTESPIAHLFQFC